MKTNVGRVGRKVRGEVGHNGMLHDPLVVRKEEVIPYIEAFLAEWERERPSEKGSPGTVDTVFTTGREYLANEVGISKRSIHAILKGKTTWVGYGYADKFLTAIGRPDLMQTLHFVSNPYWEQARWVRHMTQCETD